MSRASLIRSGIRLTGHDFDILSTGRTFRGILADDTATCLLDADVHPGDIVRDRDTGTRYIVAGTGRDPDHLTAALVPYHLTCTILRHMEGERNAFGRCVNGESAVVSASIPIAFHDEERAAVPVNTEVRHGDMIDVPQIQERYLVRLVSTIDLPGCKLLRLIKQGFPQ